MSGSGEGTTQGGLLGGYESEEEDPLADGLDARKAIAAQFLDAFNFEEEAAQDPSQLEETTAPSSAGEAPGEAGLAEAAAPEIGGLLGGYGSGEEDADEEANTSQAQQADTSQATMQIGPGCTVRLQGLRQAVALNGQLGTVQAPDPNTAGRWLVEIASTSGTEVKTIKQENLIVEKASEEAEEEAVDAEALWPGCRVRAEGLKQAAALNGRIGVAKQPDAAREGRWEVEFWSSDGSKVEAMASIKEENLVILEAEAEADAEEVEDEEMDKGDEEEVEEDDEDLDGDGLEAGAEVKISGLQSAAGSLLNGQLGTLLSFDLETSRWQVSMHSGESKAIKAENLVLSKPASGDVESMEFDAGDQEAAAEGAGGQYSGLDSNELAAATLQAELTGDDDALAGLQEEQARRQAGSAGVTGPERGGVSTEAAVEVPVEVVGAIIGAGGESIKRLSAESGARLNFAADEEPEPGSLPVSRTCMIRGPADAVQKAKQMILEAIADAFASKGDGRRGKGKGKGKGKKGGKGSDLVGEGASGSAGFEQGICKWYAAGFCRNRADGSGGCRNGLHSADAAIKAEADWIALGPPTGTVPVVLEPGRPLLLLLDLEGGGNKDGKDGEDEIIEVPVLSMCPTTGKEFGRFHRFARPGYWDREAESMRQRHHRNCFNTGSSAVPFTEVIEVMQNWIRTLLRVPEGEELKPDSFLFVTCGNWDVKSAIPRQCNKPVPGTVDFAVQKTMFSRWSNLKEVFRDFYKLSESSAPTGMRGMLKRLRIPLAGQHHLGMDDVSNLAKILERVVREGCRLEPTGHAKLGPPPGWKGKGVGKDGFSFGLPGKGQGKGKKGKVKGGKGGKGGKGVERDRGTGSVTGLWGQGAFPGPPPGGPPNTKQAANPPKDAAPVATAEPPKDGMQDFLSGAPMPGAAWGDSDDEAPNAAARPAARPGEDWMLFADEKFEEDEETGVSTKPKNTARLPAPKRSAPEAPLQAPDGAKAKGLLGVLAGMKPGAVPEPEPAESAESSGTPGAQQPCTETPDADDEPPLKLPRISNLLAGLPAPRAGI